MNIFLFIAFLLFFTLFAGIYLEKIRIPWVFGALFLGVFASVRQPFEGTSGSDVFSLMAEIGMYFLLFIIGLEHDIKKIGKQGRFITTLALSIFIVECALGSLFIYYVFDVALWVAVLVASSFATVGEAILTPILDEFRLFKTRFGQMLLGVGILDDIADLLVIAIVTLFVGETIIGSDLSLWISITLLVVLVLVPLLLEIFHKRVKPFNVEQPTLLFLFSIFILFVFVGIGDLVESAPLAAIFAGITLKNIIAKDKLAKLESFIYVIGYSLFVPIFLFDVGISVDLNYVYSAPILIIVIFLITAGTKILLSSILARKILGIKKALLLGIGLSAKFSTSIIILTTLLQQNIIDLELYSVLIGAMIVSQFFVPFSFSVLIQKWDLKFN